MKELRGLDGHIVLLCKNHYKCSSIIEGLRMIWAIRCGYEYNKNERSIDKNIANKLYKLLIELMPERINYLQERIHDEININWRFREELSSLERLISIYCSELAFIQIKEKYKNKWINLILLPKPKKRIFNRILRGNGKYKDYYLIESKN